MSIKKFLAAAALLSLSVAMYANSTDEMEAYKTGFSHGLNMIDYEIKHEGIYPHELNFTHKYTVSVPTAEMTTAEILYLEYLAARDGREPMILTDAIIFGGYDRYPDADAAHLDIREAYNLQNVVIREIKAGEKLFTSPIALAGAHAAFVKDVNASGGAVIIRNILPPEPVKIEPVKPVQTKKIIVAAPVKGIFRLRNQQTQSYTYDLKKYGKPYVSDGFKDSKIVKGKIKFQRELTAVTAKGEVFLKVSGANLFFSVEDAEILK